MDIIGKCRQCQAAVWGGCTGASPYMVQRVGDDNRKYAYIQQFDGVDHVGDTQIVGYYCDCGTLLGVVTTGDDGDNYIVFDNKMAIWPA